MNKRRTVFVLILLLLLLIGTACQQRENKTPTPVGNPGGVGSAPSFVTAPPPPPPDNSDRPIPGSMILLENADEKKIAEVQEKIRAMIREGKPLAANFPKMAAMAKMAELQPTDTIADVGAGTGLFEMELLENEYPFAKVYAVDVDRPSIDLMKFMLEETKYPGREKIVPVLSTISDTKLAPDSIDKIIMINSPFYALKNEGDGQSILDPSAKLCLESMLRALKANGRVYVLEAAQTKDNPNIPPTHYTVPFETVGFKLLSQATMTFVDKNYAFVYGKK